MYVVTYRLSCSAACGILVPRIAKQIINSFVSHQGCPKNCIFKRPSYLFEMKKEIKREQPKINISINYFVSLANLFSFKQQ